MNANYVTQQLPRVLSLTVDKLTSQNYMSGDPYDYGDPYASASTSPVAETATPTDLSRLERVEQELSELRKTIAALAHEITQRNAELPA